MSRLSEDLVLEALSALTGAVVRRFTNCSDGNTPLLTIDNFLTTVLIKPPNKPACTCPFHRSSPPGGNTGASGDTVDAVGNTIGASQLNTLQQKPQDEVDCKRYAVKREFFVKMDEFFDPRYDYDFRGLKSTETCSRGGEAYSRPCGYYRYALKVLHKYPDGNTWLGVDGWRCHSTTGEWPVSFHGTTISGAQGITSTNYKVGPGNVYGDGIYSTPDIKIANGYAKEFKSKDGKNYKVIMQNRLNPNKLVKTERKDYWLIPVANKREEAEIVKRSIRPYGILIQQV